MTESRFRFSIFNRFLVVLLSLAVLLPLFSTNNMTVYAASYTTGTYIVSHSNGVNVRSKASTSGKINGAASKGTKFKVTKISGEWGYTESIKTTKGTKKGWVNLKYCEKQSDSKKTDSKKTEISFSKMADLDTLKKGVGHHLDGTISSSNSKITSIKAAVINESTDETVLSKTVKPNQKSYSLYNSDLDNGIKFGTLSNGEYKLVYTVKTQDGTSKTHSDSFKVGKTQETNTESSGSENPGSSGYDAAAALKYAKKHWNDGKGLCAEFVSKCVTAGGINVSEARVCNLRDALKKIDGVTEIELTLETNGHILAANNPDIQPGDIILQKCDLESDGLPWAHVTIVSSIDDEEGVHVYAHNSAKNDSLFYFIHCSNKEGASNETTTCYLLHFE